MKINFLNIISTFLGLLAPTEYETVMEIKDRIKEIEETIKELKVKKNNYFL